MAICIGGGAAWTMPPILAIKSTQQQQ